MKSCISLLLLLILFLHQSFTHAATLEETCKNITDQSQGWQITYDFCLTTLQADPRSRSRAGSFQELAVVSTQLLEQNASSTQTKIEDLLKNTRDRTVKKYIDLCGHLYLGAHHDLEDAAELVVAKDYETALMMLKAASFKNQDCQVKGRELGDEDPFSKETLDLAQLINLSAAFVFPLVGGKPPVDLPLILSPRHV